MNPTIHLLYAEDNNQDRDLMQSHFAIHAPEFEIEVAGSGQGCLERLQASVFDLLLLDQHLPDLDGLEVLKSIISAGIQVPVVMVTGGGDENLVVKALRNGAAGYVSKKSQYLDTLPSLLHVVLEDFHRNQVLCKMAPVQHRILYVEHHQLDIELTLKYFAEAAPHYVIDVAETCSEAIERMMQPHRYDLVLIDLQMPDQNGLDFVLETKVQRLQMPPFIMLSGQGDEALAIASLKLGAADYVTKHEGYLDQLNNTIEKTIAHCRVNQLNEQLRIELAEHKMTEETLRNTQEKIEAMLNALPDILFEVDRDGRFYDFRAPTPELLYTKPENFLGKTVDEVLPPDASQIIMKGISEAAVTGQYKNGCYSLLTPAGLNWFELSVAPKGDPQLPDARYIAIIHDITGLKLAETELEENREKFRGLSEATFESIFISEKGICIEQNQTAEMMFGYTYDEAIGRCGTEWIAECDREMVMTNMVTGYQEPYEATALRKDGTTFPCMLRGKMMQYKGRNVRVTSLSDITERKTAETALIASQRIIGDIINTIPVRVFWKDRNLLYLGCNAIFARDAGFSDPKEIIGKDDSQMGWRDQADLYCNDDREVISTGCPKLNYEEPQTTPDGKTIILLTSKIPLQDSNGEVTGVLGTYFDITERKMAEIALKKKSEEIGNCNNFMIGRELKMIELKKEINALLKKAGEDEKYPVHI